MSTHTSNVITNTWMNPYFSFVQVLLVYICLSKKRVHSCLVLGGQDLERW